MLSIPTSASVGSSGTIWEGSPDVSRAMPTGTPADVTPVTGTPAVPDGGAAMSAEERMAAIYHAHAGPVLRRLLRLTLGDLQAAQDLMQETMLRAWRNVDALATDDVNSVRPWLFTVARRVALDAARSRAARPTETGVVELDTIAARGDDIDRLVVTVTLRSALARLSPAHRGVVVELYGRSSSAAEAATHLGIPEGTVRSRAHYALRAMRATLTAADQAAS
jgi:RNA polymerase sigma-70 factor (ECF subfamily)